ncbi:MAG: YggS family pyridoxal phosphate-dependent enzyme [Muribaculaceae bacterium]|nr:YggS family pyridoxal phosphate-dependent enzyme [Muribaculaceae bacterium]
MSHDIAKRITAIRSRLPQGVELVAVSKFHPVEELMEAYEAGQRVFGESRVQELVTKVDAMPDDVRWHFIGHLQTNKVRQLMGLCSMIESVDSERLLELIDRESERAGVVTRVLMQVHVAAEETKTGFEPQELLDYFAARKFEGLKATHLCGVMGMATNTDDMNRVSADFKAIRGIYDNILEIAPDLRGFDIVSMGMSDDHEVAIECGSTMVRIGTDIFGPRRY